MTKVRRAITAFLCLFILIPEAVKFFDPFKTVFTVQITEGQLPFATLSYGAGQLGEITVGVVLFTLVFFLNSIPEAMA